jgi:hypothetical protein
LSLNPSARMTKPISVASCGCREMGMQ